MPRLLAGAVAALAVVLAPTAAVAATPIYPTGVEASSVAPCQSLTPTLPQNPGGPDKGFTQEKIESEVTLVKVGPGGDKADEGKTGFSRVGGTEEDDPCVEADDFQINEPGTYRVDSTQTVLVWKSVAISPEGYCGEHPTEETCSGWLQTGSTKTTSSSTFRVTGLPKRFDKKTKDLFNQISTRRNFHSSALGGAAAIGCPFLGPAAVACGVIGGALSLGALAESYIYAELAKDPVDRAFRTVAAPRATTPPHVTAQDGISPAAAAAVNALSDNAAAQTAQGAAMLTALDRAQGAHLAKKRKAERMQLAAARAAAKRIATLLDKEPGLRRAAVAALQAGGFTDVGVAKTDVSAYRSTIFLTLPDATRRGLGSLGLPAARIAGVAVDQRTRSIAGQPANVTLLGVIADPRTLQDSAAAAGRLRAFARGRG